MIDYSFEYANPDFAMKVLPKLMWQKPGVKVDAVRIHDDLCLTLDNGAITSGPFLKLVKTKRDAASWLWVCNVEFNEIQTVTNFLGQAVHYNGRTRTDFDAFKLISLQRNAQLLTILSALTKK